MTSLPNAVVERPGWGSYSPPKESPQPSRQPVARIQSLDGLRAISIVLVLIGHISATRNAPVWYRSIQSAFGLDVAHLGVEVFFVISGFLITRLLMAEWDASGTLDLRRFYVRRFVRLMPGYAALVLVAAAAWQADMLRLTGLDLLHAVTYSMDYANTPSWSLGHLWSLAVEEQFYFLWPCTFLLLGRRRAAMGAAAAVVLLPFVRMELLALNPGLSIFFEFHFESCADILAFGCLLALWGDAYARSTYAITIRKYSWALAPLLVVITPPLVQLHWRAQAVVPNLMTGLAIVLLLDWAIHLPPTSVAARALNNRPIVFIGQISYSLYLWQQLFLNQREVHWWTTYPLNVVLAAAAAVSAYFVIERPALRRRSRIENWLFGSSAPAGH